MILPHIFWSVQPHIKQTSILTSLGFLEVSPWKISQKITSTESTTTTILPTVVQALHSGMDSHVFHAAIQLQFSTLPLENVMFALMEQFMTVPLIHANKEDLKTTNQMSLVNHTFWFPMKLRKVLWINTWTLENNHVQKQLHLLKTTAAFHVQKINHILTSFPKTVKPALIHSSLKKASTNVFKELQMPLMSLFILQDWLWMTTQPMKIGTIMFKKTRKRFSVQMTNLSGLVKNASNALLYLTS